MKRPKLNSIEGISAAALIERDRERVANKQADREAKRTERERSCRKCGKAPTHRVNVDANTKLLYCAGCLPKHLELGAELITHE